MELFLPSVIVLLIAAAVVFFLLPKFGPATLAIISAVLLAMGIYQHYNTFGTEYRFSTWQIAAFSPYFLIGGLLIVIAIFLLYTIPVASVLPSVEMPTVNNMPPANTSTNFLTNAINNTISTATNLVNGKPNNSNNIFNNIVNNLGFNKNNNRGNKGIIPWSQY